MAQAWLSQVSLLASGHFDLPDGIIFSVPVTFKDGEWSVFKSVTVKEELEERLQLLASEIAEVCRLHRAPKERWRWLAWEILCCHFCFLSQEKELASADTKPEDAEDSWWHSPLCWFFFSTAFTWSYLHLWQTSMWCTKTLNTKRFSLFFYSFTWGVAVQVGPPYTRRSRRRRFQT